MTGRVAPRTAQVQGSSELDTAASAGRRRNGARVTRWLSVFPPKALTAGRSSPRAVSGAVPPPQRDRLGAGSLNQVGIPAGRDCKNRGMPAGNRSRHVRIRVLRCSRPG